MITQVGVLYIIRADEDSDHHLGPLPHNRSFALTEAIQDLIDKKTNYVLWTILHVLKVIKFFFPRISMPQNNHAICCNHKIPKYWGGEIFSDLACVCVVGSPAH